MTGTLTTSNAVLPIFFITSLNPPVLLRYLLDTLRRYAPPVLLGGGGGLLGGPPVRLRGGGPGLRGGPPVLLGPYGPGLGLGGDITIFDSKKKKIGKVSSDHSFYSKT